MNRNLILAILAGFGLAAIFSPKRATVGAPPDPSANGDITGGAPTGAQTRVIEREYFITRKPRKPKGDSSSAPVGINADAGGTKPDSDEGAK